MQLSSKPICTDWNGPIGWNRALRLRYCLESPRGFVGNPTILNDPSPFFTLNPCDAQQFVSFERAAKVAKDLHDHPDLIVREIRFKKTGRSWQPVNG